MVDYEEMKVSDFFWIVGFVWFYGGMCGGGIGIWLSDEKSFGWNEVGEIVCFLWVWNL